MPKEFIEKKNESLKVFKLESDFVSEGWQFRGGRLSGREAEDPKSEKEALILT